MADKNDSSGDELKEIKSIQPNHSILNDYIIPKRIIYANSLIQSLKNKKYTWANEGRKVKETFNFKILSETSGYLSKEQKKILKYLILTENTNEYRKEVDSNLFYFF